MGRLHATMLTELQKVNPEVHPVFEFSLPGGTKRYAPSGVSSTSQGFYQGKILRVGSFICGVSEKKTSLELVETDVEISDVDYEFTKILEGSSGDQVRNSTAKRILASPNVSQANWFTEFEGRIARTDMMSPLTYNIVIRPNDLPLRQYTPKHSITLADWPDAHADALGQYVPLIYGTHDSSGITDKGMVPCSYVDTSTFSYLVCFGIAKDITGVYKDGTKLASSAWSRVNTLKNGRQFTLIDFTTDQGESEIDADVKGYEVTGDGTGALITNPSDQIKHFLVNFVWGNYSSGNWLADASAPIDTTHASTSNSFLAALGAEGSWRIADSQRTGLDCLNEWLESQQGIRAFWTNEGKLAWLPMDFRTTTVYYDSPYLRGDSTDLGQFVYRENENIVDRIDIQYLYGAKAGQFHQTLQVRDPSLNEEAAESLQLYWSAARLQ